MRHFVNEAEDITKSSVKHCKQYGQVDHVADPERLVDDGLHRDEDAEPFPTQLLKMARRGMERQTESFAEHEEAQQDGPESPDRRHKEEAEPDGRGFQLGDGEGPKSHEQRAVPDVADHETEKEGSRDEEEQRGIQLAVARRRIEMDQELEGFRRFGVSEEDRGVRFFMFGLRVS